MHESAHEKHKSSKMQGRSGQICWYFRKGMCRFGDRCTYSHDVPESSSNQKPGKESETKREIPKCAICYEYPPSKGRRYGLLSGCDHVYCLECIRQWRRTDSQRKDIVRTCPMCRQTSYFVVPAHSHVKGEDKRRTIERFKQSTSTIPCRYKSQGRKCPFGHRCFYLHLDENGCDTKPAERKEWERQQKRRERRSARARRHVEFMENILPFSLENRDLLSLLNEDFEFSNDDLILAVLATRDLNIE